MSIYNYFFNSNYKEAKLIEKRLRQQGCATCIGKHGKDYIIIYRPQKKLNTISE